MMSLAKLAAHASSPALDAYDARAHAGRPLPGAVQGQSGPGLADAARARDQAGRRAEGELRALAAQEALGLGWDDERPRGPEELVALVGCRRGAAGAQGLS
jgi:hypothetical protein